MRRRRSGAWRPAIALRPGGRGPWFTTALRANRVAGEQHVVAQPLDREFPERHGVAHVLRPDAGDRLGAADAPTIFGAITIVTLSTRRWSKNEPCSTPPPSTCNASTPRRPSSCSSGTSGTRPVSSGWQHQHLVARGADASRQASGERSVVTISVFAAPSRTRAVGAMRPVLSATIAAAGGRLARHRGAP